MPKIFLSDVPCTDEFLSGLNRIFPEIDPFSFYTYLKVRRVTSDLENTLESYFAAHGISAGRFMLLMLLSTKPEGMMPSELAQQCGVTQATISGLLNGLEKSQMILRETHNHDGRAYVIKLSEKGGTILNQIKPEFLRCIGDMMAKFDLDEKRTLVDLLSKLSGELKLISDLKTARLSAAN